MSEYEVCAHCGEVRALHVGTAFACRGQYEAHWHYEPLSYATLRAKLAEAERQRDEAVKLLRECRRWVEYAEDRARHDDDGANGGLRVMAALDTLDKLDAYLAAVSQPGG